MKYIAFLSVVMLLGSAQWPTVTSLSSVDVSDPPPTADILDNSPGEIIRNIHWNEATDELYQGDIVLTDEQRRSMVLRKAIQDVRYRWPKSVNGTVIIDYRYADTVVDRPGVVAAMALWEQATCVKFNEIPAQVAKPHLIFVTSTTSCSSSVGQLYSQNGQDVNLMPSCFNGGTDTVVHELGHAIGLWHEQSRSDRDDYLYIMLANVIAGKEHNFNKEISNNYGLPYDYSSIMQYTSTAFTSNGLDTIVAKDPLAQPLVVNHQGLSFMDKKIVNLMYNCTDTWLVACGLTIDRCQNQGYTNSNCSCECPAGTSGPNCETLNLPYIDALINAKSPGSQRITTEGTITSPGYPVPVTTATSRVQSIEAPECHTVKLTFNVFDMQGLSNLTSTNGNTVTKFQACWFMILEIKLDDPPITGTKYCGANITASQTFESVGRFMVLTFSSRALASNTKTGYSATVQFVPVATGNCTNTTTSTSTTSTTTTTESTTSTTTPTPTSTTTPTPTSTTESTTTPTTTFTITSTLTSTTTPTTASTTTPTTTSTTTPTTTSTPTTMRTSTTTRRTTSTTARAPSPGRFINSGRLPLTLSGSTGQCSLVSSANPSIFFYRSPNFPRNYGRNRRCSTWFNTTEPRYLKVVPLILNLDRSDRLDLFSAYQTTTSLNARRVGTSITLPTTASKITFQSSRSSRTGRFAIGLEVVNNGCHQLVKLNARSNGPLSIPANYRRGTVCEWWLRAPVGRKVRVSFSSFSIGASNCLTDYVVIDRTGDSRYVTRSTRYCGGNANSPGTVVSTGNALNILVNGQRGNYRGLRATYSVV